MTRERTRTAERKERDAFSAREVQSDEGELEGQALLEGTLQC